MLGVLGGMGPMATVDFMGKVVGATPATCDQDHIPMIVISASDLPNRNAAIMGHGPDPFPGMRAALRRLESAGATAIAMPCNTAHYWHARLQAETSVPILHIADVVADALARDGLRECPIGIMATNGTLQVGIYQKHLGARGYTCRIPDAAGQLEITRAISLVKIGQIAEATAIFRAQAEALRAAGCRKVLMACTEIPVALPSATSDPWLIDATDLLAQACVAFFKDRRSRAPLAYGCGAYRPYEDIVRNAGIEITGR